MTRKDQPPPRLDRLAGFARVFADPTFVAASFVPANSVPQGQRDSAWPLEFVEYTSSVRAFIETAYEDDWVRTDVDWVAWSQTPAARTLHGDPAAVADASVTELAHLLTAVIRRERFVEGSLAGAFEGGLILRIVRRVRALSDAQTPADGQVHEGAAVSAEADASVHAHAAARPTGSQPSPHHGAAHDDRALLASAVAAYAYPAVSYDFERQVERAHADVRELEQAVHADLTARRSERVRAGLANILYWGYARQGRRDARVRSFLEAVTPEHLARASATFEMLQGPGLRQLKRIGLPRFSQVTFLSKLRMFLDPTRYAALDLKLAKLRLEQHRTLLHDLKVQPTSIPVTEHNERVYAAWCSACLSFAATLGRERGWRAADVERGFFQLVDTGHVAVAARLLAETAVGAARRARAP